ncbi:MAG TPA: SRPBCC family protein, partial [Gemmatimonadaceae bacterium]|nr:SRPBCC family protein [Gemmatimonadaceae bacterium]
NSRTRSTMRALGLRELTSGAGILTQPDSAGWVWSRVAGDMMDLALLGRIMSDERADRDRTAMATAAVLGVAALDVICARQLSRDGAAREEGMQGALARRGTERVESVTILSPREEVYEFWRDFQNLPRFMRHLESVRVLDDRRSHWVARAPAGRTVEWEAEIVEDRPNELIAWRSVAGADVDNAGHVRFSDAPGGRGTEVTVALRYDPPAGKLGAAVAKLFHEEPGQQVEEDLRRFKQVMETGDIVVSDATVDRGPHPAQPVAHRGRAGR